jgi:AraC family transcriptional activator of mtrCDE
MASAIRGLIDLMVAELNRRAPGFYAVINHLAYLLFVQVLRQQIEQGKVDSGLLAALFDSKISRALSAIHNHPGRRWTLESLASEAAMGRSSFARSFNELTGVPPMQYLTAWRMQEAKTLLTGTTLSLGHIAEHCGYESEAAFRKAFKKTVGSPPGEVRKRQSQ